MVVAAASSRRRLVAPVQHLFAREELYTDSPAFLGSPTGAPPLLSFEGERFVEDLNAVAAGTAPLPFLYAWRDWAEPPSGMIGANRATLYGSAIRRHPPLSVAPEPAGVDADGVPSASPAFLRKLYLPLHLRFTYLAFDLICRRPGLPRVARHRVRQTGVIVRRLIRDSASERWEDWITADGKRGLWFELAGGLPADPAAIPAAAWNNREVELRARLGIAPTAPMPGLEAAHAAPLSVGSEALTIAGLVPVFSAAEQAGDDAPGPSEAQIAQQLADQARAALAEWWADAAALRQAIAAPLRDLLALTILPPRPSAAAVASAQNAIAAHGLNAATHLAAFVQAAQRRAAAQLTPGTADTQPPLSPAAFWTSGGSGAPALAANDVQPINLASAPAADWNTLVIEQLHAMADLMLAAGGIAAPSDAQAGLLALALLRLRRARIALLAALWLQTGQPAPDLTGTVPDIVDSVAGSSPRATAASAGAEIELLLGLDQNRAPPEFAPDFAPLSLLLGGSSRAIDTHRAGLALETVIGAIEEAGNAAGNAFAEELKTRRAAAAQQVGGWLGLGAPEAAKLRAAGLDLREQPASGLLVFPGPAPQTAVLDAMREAVAVRYEGAGGLPEARKEIRARSRVKRLRFDHDSIYAAWGFARIAGRDPCEGEQVVWTGRSEPFTIAEPTDVLGVRPVTIQMPDIPRLIRDIPRIGKARARPYSSFVTPRNSAITVGASPTDTRRQWGIGFICSFGIPVVTICAFILFSIIFSILIAIPGFTWMLLLKFCLPVPTPKKGI